MIIELTSISASRGREDQLSDAMESLIRPIQVQPGCLECTLLKSSESRLYMLARWETQKDLVRHLQSALYKRLLLLMELSATPPMLQFYSVVDISGLDLVNAARTLPD